MEVTMMKFSSWARLADEYAVKYWGWAEPSYDVAQAYRYYMWDMTPKEFIDHIATSCSFDEPQGEFDFSTYTTPPTKGV
jgi:hypothetical protein